MFLLNRFSFLLWQWILPILLTLSACYCGIKFHWRPLSCFPQMLRDTFGQLLHPRDAKQRKIFSATLAATMGTGNLAGTALALMTGGAGALFWMWISALLGMLLVYAENFLSVRCRKAGLAGALGYLALLPNRFPQLLFACCCVGAALGMGCMVQSNTLAQTAQNCGIPLPLSGILTAIALFCILKGGAKSVYRTADWLMPLIFGGYLLGCGFLLSRHAAALPDTLRCILREAWGFRPAGVGFATSAFLQSMSVGLRRGIFSNEAGLGSSSLLHAESDLQSPDLLGKWAAAAVFADTILCCTATALVILSSPHCNLHTMDASGLLLAAFSDGLGRAAMWFLAICLILLAFATIIGWYPCGLAAVRFLFGNNAEPFFLCTYILLAFAGSLGNPQWLWTFCDCCNGLMALPNLYGMIWLLHNKKGITAQSQ